MDTSIIYALLPYGTNSVHIQQRLARSWFFAARLVTLSKIDLYMPGPITTKQYFFIDESGDPEFYGHRHKLLVGTPGYQPILLMGMIQTSDRKLLRHAMLKLKDEIENDPLYNRLHSVNPGWYFHAIEDHPDIRTKVISLIRNLEGFRTFIVIGRKSLRRFEHTHKSQPEEFYHDLLYHLLKNRMKSDQENYQLFLAHRQEARMENFQNAIQRAIERDNQRRSNQIAIQYHSDIVLSSEYPEMSIIDYMLWALQRYIIKKEDRFYAALIGKYNLIIDLYDTAHYSKATSKTTNYYSKANQFSLEKASEFDL
jgi:hypothetical protein